MTTYAIPNGDGTYQYLDAATTSTFSIGSLSFPPPWLSKASSAQIAAMGILAVVDTPAPIGNFGSITSSIQLLNGIPTVVWATTPYVIVTRTKDVLASQMKKAAAAGDQTTVNQLLAQILAL